ncbi:hypothetical protein P2G88_08130 [Aliiglaciecola sp. CAU 1673]|uniref:hypothetical protein n=1 Tax=Aliiglaciecola sp. CAU 1673 TaxID=3032595 RepID=UPI0023DB2605|nr:hypothetical protein [Aliiglaciecola sp. CAU 1673]MDF2178218.1 hypothetical protein [Aliiglaciecola sp. CAU 1673]
MQKQAGLGLVELMIASLLGLSAIAALASVMGLGIGTSGNLINQSRLNEELKAVSSLITRELKRTGYNGNTLGLVGDPTANPSAFSNSLQVSAFPGEANNSCILFSYDSNGNGVLDVAGTNENYGFRLRDEAIEFRQGGLGCADAGWQDLTEKSMVEVSQLTFNITPVTVNNVTRYDISITLVGHFAANPSLSRSYQEQVSVRSYD